ncbi:SDR family oxidoreductase [Microbulbifer variabilis]|uniref:SDR family oxidoreductase n=1 Tax=Microbulbifer variabilis TaxID=266805 RepID=UPI001CFD34E3|nr:SDR family oxidoreductase [Microbulbifer variabilis]
MEKTVLVLGATGGIGGEVARQLRDSGWEVRALQRNIAAPIEQREGITWLKGDALDATDVESAAEGCEVIVHAVNPPGYRNWAGLALPMLDNTLAAAKKMNATILLPGTVYNYGPDAFPLLKESTPQCPQTRKGAIRVEMERRLRNYAKNAGIQDGARVLIVRAGDFFGPRAGNSWFSQGLVKPGCEITTIYNPGLHGVGHQWSYLPDVAHTMMLLLERRATLETFACFHLAGHWDTDGTQMVKSIRRVAARYLGREAKIRGFPWWLIRLISPFQETLRELVEMRYLWQEAVHMDNRKLISVLGHEPLTPLDMAVEESLRGLRCLS